MSDLSETWIDIWKSIDNKYEINYINMSDNDGNPIFSAISKKDKKSVRIIHHKNNKLIYDYNIAFKDSPLESNELLIWTNSTKKQIEKIKILIKNHIF